MGWACLDKASGVGWAGGPDAARAVVSAWERVRFLAELEKL